MNITNAVPPICTKHHETMVLSFYDRPGSPPGNGYACRSCAKERQTAAQGLSVDYDPSKSRLQSADSALDRASIPEMFNVLAGEIRGVNETLHRMRDVADNSRVRLGAIEARLSDLKVMDAHIDAQNQGLCNLFDLVSTELVPVRSCLAAIESQLSTFKDGTYERINLLATDNEKMQAQLTALRAEADKAREEGANHYEAIHTKFMEVYKRLTSMENRMADLQLSVDAMHGPKRGDVTGSIRGIDVHVKALAEGLANSNRWQSEHECLLAAVHTLIVRQTKGTGRKKKQERKQGRK